MLYPNPASETVHLECGLGRETTNLKLRDMRGRQLNVIFAPLGSGHWTFDMSALENGSYLLTWDIDGVAFSTPVHKIHP